MGVTSLVWRGCWMLGIPVLSPLYKKLNHNNGKVHTLVTRLDRSIPLIPPFIVPYFAWYGFVFAMLVWLNVEDSEVYAATLTAIFASLLICYGIYAGFQSVAPRPEIQGTNIFARMTKRLYNLDNPYNAFPSIHVTTSWIMVHAASSIKKDYPVAASIAQTLSGTIIMSTLFLKQHVVLDVLAGLLLAQSTFKGANCLVQRVSNIIAK